MSIRTGNAAVDRALDVIRREQAATSFSSGTSVLKNISLPVGAAVKVPHKLGRRAQGYVVVGCRAGAAGLVTDNNGADLDTYLTLTAVGASMVVDLLVF